MNNDEIIFNKDGSWIRKSQLEERKKIQEYLQVRFEKRLLLGDYSKEASDKHKLRQENKDNLCWAWIKVKGKRKMCWVDTKTNKAYKADGYAKTSMEIKNFTFERWCTGFDL